MLYREIIAVCSQIHTKHINTLCGRNVELLNVKPGGKHSNFWTLKGKLAIFSADPPPPTPLRRNVRHNVHWGRLPCVHSLRGGRCHVSW